MQGAEPTFENQTEVVCWIEWSKVINGVDPDNIIQPAKPRANFPNYDNVPKSDQISIEVKWTHFIHSLK